MVRVSAFPCSSIYRQLLSIMVSLYNKRIKNYASIGPITGQRELTKNQLFNLIKCMNTNFFRNCFSLFSISLAIAEIGLYFIDFGLYNFNRLKIFLCVCLFIFFHFSFFSTNFFFKIGLNTDQNENDSFNPFECIALECFIFMERFVFRVFTIWNSIAI